MINSHRGYFPVSGRSFPQTGHVFSVGLMCRAALQWEHVILLSFIFFSSAIYWHPKTKLTPVALKGRRFIWQPAPVRSVSSVLTRASIFTASEIDYPPVRSTFSLGAYFSIKDTLKPGVRSSSALTAGAPILAASFFFLSYSHHTPTLSGIGRRNQFCWIMLLQTYRHKSYQCKRQEFYY